MEDLYKKVADKVLSESLHVAKGETVTIETWNNGVDFAREVALEARHKGSIPLVLLEDEEAYLKGVRAMPEDILGTMGRHEYALLSQTDAYVFIPGPPVGGYTTQITGKEYVDSIKYNRSWYESAEKAKLRGVRMTFGYVGGTLTEMLGKSASDVVEHQLNACLVDYRKLKTEGEKMVPRLKDGYEASLSSDGAELSFMLKGEIELQDGVTDEADVKAGNNMSYVPPGLLVKEVDPSSVNGTVKISPSITRLGMIKDAEIELKDGQVKDYKSHASSKALEGVFEIMKRQGGKVSYFGLGLNPRLDYGYAHDRFVDGSLSLSIGFNAIFREGNLTIDGEKIVQKGKRFS